MSDDKERHFDREMADVDRLLKKLPTYEPERMPRGDPTVQRPAAGHSGSTPSAAGGAGAWLRVGLGLALAGGMGVWPYSHICGIKLFLYIGGVGTLVVAGVWGAWAAWAQRSGVAHTLSLGVLLWGLVLGAGVVLPRVGYTGADALWFCPEPQAPAAS